MPRHTTIDTLYFQLKGARFAARLDKNVHADNETYLAYATLADAYVHQELGHDVTPLTDLAALHIDRAWALIREG